MQSSGRRASRDGAGHDHAGVAPSTRADPGRPAGRGGTPRTTRWRRAPWPAGFEKVMRYASLSAIAAANRPAPRRPRRRNIDGSVTSSSSRRKFPVVRRQQVHPRVQRLAPQCLQDPLAGRQLRRARRHRDHASAVLRLHAEVARGRDLPHGVAEPPVEIQERQLAHRGHLRHVGLHHHGALRQLLREEALAVRERVRPHHAGPARARRHDRLEDRLPPPLLGQDRRRGRASSRARATGWARSARRARRARAGNACRCSTGASRQGSRGCASPRPDPPRRGTRRSCWDSPRWCAPRRGRTEAQSTRASFQTRGTPSMPACRRAGTRGASSASRSGSAAQVARATRGIRECRSRRVETQRPARGPAVEDRDGGI